jgi:hypothetical protein
MGLAAVAELRSAWVDGRDVQDAAQLQAVGRIDRQAFLGSLYWETSDPSLARRACIGGGKHSVHGSIEPKSKRKSDRNERNTKDTRQESNSWLEDGMDFRSL